MAVPSRRAVVFVIGTTGAGKSKLAVDLALQVEATLGIGCEIINADVMQMFKGLDIITNKVTLEEQRGVPHHLLGFLDAATVDFNVVKFCELAVPLIEDIFSRHRLPIVVGGSHYYVESLLFDTLVGTQEPPQSLISAAAVDGIADPAAPSSTADAAVGPGAVDEGTGVSDACPPTSLGHSTGNSDDPSSRPREAALPWGHLSETSPLEEIQAAYAKLQEVDPAMAQRLHPRNARKIKRSLQVHHETGVPHSKWIAEQRQYQLRYADHVLLFLDAQSECLSRRLDQRVEGMMRRGLRQEIEAFNAAPGPRRPPDTSAAVACAPAEGTPPASSAAPARAEPCAAPVSEACGSSERSDAPQVPSGSPEAHGCAFTDFTHGLLQSIGFKEFEPYFNAAKAPDGAEPRDAGAAAAVWEGCVASLQAHTRRYANRQRQWVRNRFAVHAHVRLLAFDSTGAVEEGVDLDSDASCWRRNVVLPAAGVVRDLLEGGDVPRLHAGRCVHSDKAAASFDSWKMYRCDDCERDIHGALQWEAHLKSKGHKKRKEWAKKKDIIEFYKRRRLEAAEPTIARDEAQGEAPQPATAQDQPGPTRPMV